MDFQISLYQKKIIISLLLDSCPKITNYIYEPNTNFSLRYFPEDILRSCWELSAEEKLLVCVILDIWCGQGHVFLSELLTGLSSKNLSMVLFALKKFNESKNGFKHRKEVRQWFVKNGTDRLRKLSAQSPDPKINP